jgi:hypothetical protein
MRMPRDLSGTELAKLLNKFGYTIIQLLSQVKC